MTCFKPSTTSYAVFCVPALPSCFHFRNLSGEVQPGSGDIHHCLDSPLRPEPVCATAHIKQKQVRQASDVPDWKCGVIPITHSAAPLGGTQSERSGAQEPRVVGRRRVACPPNTARQRFHFLLADHKKRFSIRRRDTRV
jgi:hypothetical protein